MTTTTAPVMRANQVALDRTVGHGALQLWAQTQPAKSPSTGLLRFAFYGRVSTEDFQDPATSRGWQLRRAQSLIAGCGRITTEFFDIGVSRSLPWQRRPQAAALLAALTDPGRDFDAIVIGSSERAFSDPQFTTMSALFAHHDVQLWMPELGGALDPQLCAHEELMTLLGLLAKREVVRARVRARTAMAVQARDQDRYLGGRPPYGYRLTHAGPHPNRAWARRGARAQRLETDPTAAPVVRWIFTQRRTGTSLARITRALNAARIPSPSATDPARNRHRPGRYRQLTTVRAILANPRYTGRQVWNRTHTQATLFDPADATLGHRGIQRWNAPNDWIISTEPAHPALITEDDFLAAQHPPTGRPAAPGHHYRLAGMLRCGQCGRRLDSCWSHDRPAYRCRHGRTSASGHAPGDAGSPNAYVREDRVLAHLPALVVRLPGAYPSDPVEAAIQLRHQHITLTYHPREETLTADTPAREKIFIG